MTGPLEVDPPMTGRAVTLDGHSRSNRRTSTIELGLARHDHRKHDHRKRGGKRYWLDSKRNVARVFYGLIAIDVLWLAADFVHHKHSEWSGLEGSLHEFDAWVGFFPVYGFVGAFLLVLAAKQMRRVLMRPEDYYDGDERSRSS